MPDLDLDKHYVQTPEAQREQRFRDNLARMTFLKLCVMAHRDPKTKAVSFYLGVYGKDIASDFEGRYAVPAFIPRADTSLVDIIMDHRAQPAKWPNFYLNNVDRQGNNALICLKNIIDAYATRYGLMEIDWFEGHLTNQLRAAYEKMHEPKANPKRLLVEFLLDVWPGVVKEQPAAPTTSKPISEALSQGVAQATSEEAPASKKPKTEAASRRERTKPVVAPTVTHVTA